MRQVIKDSRKLKARKNTLGVHKRLNPVAFKGYPGLANTASEIAQYIPKCETFVEAFAGLGRISKFVTADYYVLNDMSDFAVSHCRSKFPRAYVTQTDYSDITWTFASKKTVRFYDPPWNDELYSENPLTRNIRSFKVIYSEILEEVKKLEGDWIVAGAVNGPLAKWPNIENTPDGYYHKEVQSRKKALFGLKARTYLVSNKPFVNHWQEKLF